MAPPALYTTRLMAMSHASLGRGWMVPDPDLPPFDWRRDGAKWAWLLVGIGAFLFWVHWFVQPR